MEVVDLYAYSQYFILFIFKTYLLDLNITNMDKINLILLFYFVIYLIKNYNVYRCNNIFVVTICTKLHKTKCINI